MEAVPPINQHEAALPIYLFNGRFYRGYVPAVSLAAVQAERFASAYDRLVRQARDAEKVTASAFTEATKQTLSDLAAGNYQVGGAHYTSLSIQPWDAMKAWMSPEQFKGFLLGNAIKYLARCEKKGGLQDLEKAAHYLDKLIELEKAK